MNARASVACLAGLLAGCNAGPGQDWLIASAGSPDGRYVARAWCEDLCDVPGRLTLTLSRPDRVMPVSPVDPPFPPKGDAPADDFVLLVRDGNAPDFPSARLVWTDPRTLKIALPCPEADVGNPAPPRLTARGITLHIVSSAPCRTLPR